MKQAFYIKRTIAGTIFDILNALFMTVFVFLMVYPFINLLALSFNDGVDAVKGGIYFWPRKFSLASYQYMLKNPKLIRGTFVSIMRVIVGTATGLLGSALLGYIVSCRHFYGRRFMRVLFIITMYFGGGLIPTYLLMLRLGLSNTFHVYWIPGIFSAYYMLLISSYIQNLPESLFESARIDGASELRTFIQIALPLSVPVLACIAVYIGVGQWNSWFDVSLYSKDGKWDNLQIILNRLLNQAAALENIMEQQRLYEEMRRITPQTVRAATTMIVTLPIIFIYPFFQKYFISGITLGAVKG
ncbi:MAG: carbohydrate ABC transporter permease [Caldicoprobacterales bacterium]|jgi:putative aldouronate transport system permease protein|nr:carbohydrate ABC transporter permease [Clostridiales bacterium]